MMCSLGLSKLLPERLTKRNLTFYHVCTLFTTFGCTFLNEILSFSAWIGSIQVRILICCSGGNSNSPVDQYFLCLFPALISGRLFDLGYFHSTLIFASTNLVVCTFLIAQCHEVWQLLLCQGFGIGVSLWQHLSPLQDLISAIRCSQISCGLIFGPVISVLAHWFKKRRSTALGIVTFASSIGGMVFPVVLRNLLITVGYAQIMNLRLPTQLELRFLTGSSGR